MNLFQIISQLEKVDPEAMDRLNSRRDVFATLAHMGKKAAIAATPIAIGSLFNKAFAGTKDVNSVLNYALLLEYLEEDFYAQALAKTGLIPTGPPTAAVTQIKKHESAHVALLKGALGSNANARPTGFDFGTAFDTYINFLTTAQALEDTGVRAYKGKAGELKDSGDILTIALQIHSVEARHAAHIRNMRRSATGGGIKQSGWITNAENNGSPAPVYGAGNPSTTFPSEANTTQAGLNLMSALGTAYTANEVSEAFDEALDEATVKAIAGPFIKM
jgi:hypothetical protein